MIIRRTNLRAMLTPELISELSCLPIKPFQMGDIKFDKERAWRQLISQTIIPLCRHQLEDLKQYRSLLTEEEKKIADKYTEIIEAYISEWRTHRFSFPPQPLEFINFLKD